MSTSYFLLSLESQLLKDCDKTGYGVQYNPYIKDFPNYKTRTYSRGNMVYILIWTENTKYCFVFGISLNRYSNECFGKNVLSLY